MGMNYEMFAEDYCLECGRGLRIHLGKRSAGWKFLLQYNKGKYYQNWEEMKEFLRVHARAGAVIRNEAGEPITAQHFIELVESSYRDKSNADHSKTEIDGYLADSQNYEFLERDFS